MAFTKCCQSAASFDKFWAVGKPIWGKSANYYVHNYRYRQVHKTYWAKSIHRFQRSAFRKVWFQFVPNLTSFWSMGKWPRQCTTTGLDNSTELRTYKIRQAVTEIWVLQVWQPPARPAARAVTTITLHPGGLRGNKSTLNVNITQCVVFTRNVNIKIKESKYWTSMQGTIVRNNHKWAI